ncbi:sodium-independent anion transporter [Methylobacterium sp. P31]
MYYANVEQLSEQVTALVASAEPPLRCFAIDMVAVDDVDFTAAETLRSLRGILQCKGVRLVLLEVAENVRAELERYRLLDLLPNETGATVSDFVLSYDRDGAPGV